MSERVSSNEPQNRKLVCNRRDWNLFGAGAEFAKGLIFWKVAIRSAPGGDQAIDPEICNASPAEVIGGPADKRDERLRPDGGTHSPGKSRLESLSSEKQQRSGERRGSKVLRRVLQGWVGN